MCESRYELMKQDAVYYLVLMNISFLDLSIMADFYSKNVGEKNRINLKTLDITGLFRFSPIIPPRHSHASLLIELGENPLIIRDRLGHEDIETTLGTYGHLYPNTNYEVASKLNGIININPNDTKAAVNRNQFTVEVPKNVQ